MPRPTRTARAPAPPPTPTLGDSLDFLRTLWSLTHELRTMSKRMRSRIGLTGPQRLVIRVLGELPDLSASALADLIRLHPSTLTGILRRLEQRKLIVRGAHPHDGRRAVLRLTPAGLRLNKSSEHTVEAVVTRALAGLDAGAVRTTTRSLDAVIAHLRDG
jgi:DNA-binding MarR family transcriptional regulator